METPIKESDFSFRFGKHLHEKGILEEDYFNCLNHLLDYGGVKTVSQLAKERKVSPQYIYQTEKTFTLLGIKVVFDNK